MDALSATPSVAYTAPRGPPYLCATPARTLAQIAGRNLEGTTEAALIHAHKSAALAPMAPHGNHPSNDRKPRPCKEKAMAHELETLANGQTAFASARRDAWHQLGQITEACMSADEIMTKAFLGGWKVRKIPLLGIEVTDQGVQRIECPDRWMTVRTNIVSQETEYLGVVGLLTDLPAVFSQVK